MAILEIRKYPDPILREVGEPIRAFDANLRRLVADMTETMYAEPGVGLAATQVGVKLRLFIADSWLFDGEEGKTMVFANPEILRAEGTQTGEEGCLSFPGIFEPVTRPNRCELRAQDIDGKELQFTAEGLGARAILHEVDHLEGRLLIDYLSPLKRALVRKEAKKGFPNASQAKEERKIAG